jgi:hypothetical protein
MAIRPGSRVGPYEIIALIGAGGMGEVYGARDTRLGRDVAIKVLPAEFAADPERLRRFEQEARAVAALDHPNILALYDVGTHEGSPYIVTQLLEGESLRERLSGGAMPVRRAVETAIQIAQGLAAAHEKGIIHRDLKPGNVFVAKDGHVKILDFGLAKLAPPRTLEEKARATTVMEATDAGVVLGTVGYMSPEQVLGRALDARSDLFSLGVLLYEMLSGTRPFQKESAPETMAAILKEEPPDLAEIGKSIPPGLDRIVRHCLEKEPSIRFQTARDVAFALESMSQATSAATAPLRALSGRRRFAVVMGGVALVAALGAVLVLLGLFLGQRTSSPSVARFTPLTFRRGWVSGARFTADGQTVVYSASWAGAPAELFSTHLGSPESAALGYSHAHLLAVSPTGELALLRGPDELALIRSLAPFRLPAPSTLAVAPFSGGTPRDLDETGFAADYSPDGRAMAIARTTGTGTQLEYPVGTVRAKGVWGTRPGYAILRLTVVRLSPDGRRIAYFKDGKELIVEDVGGASRTLAVVPDPCGLAWAPKGNEIWFTDGRRMCAVTLGGRQRDIFSQPDRVFLHDVARDGRALVTVVHQARWMFFRRATDAAEQDLTWLDWSTPIGLSADGRLLVFFESELGVGGVSTVFVRDTTGAPPVKLGEGNRPQRPAQLSPDGRFVAAVPENANEIVVYPVGPGAQRRISLSGIEVRTACPLPDGTRVCVFGNEPTREERIWLTDVSGSKPLPVSPEGVTGIYPWVTADGLCAVGRVKGATWLYPLEGGEPQALPDIHENESIAGIATDRRFAFVYQPFEVPVRVFKVDLRNGVRELFREFAPADRAGVGLLPPRVLMTPDGGSYVYCPARLLSDLYLVEGLK